MEKNVTINVNIAELIGRINVESTKDFSAAKLQVKVTDLLLKAVNQFEVEPNKEEISLKISVDTKQFDKNIAEMQKKVDKLEATLKRIKNYKNESTKK